MCRYINFFLLEGHFLRKHHVKPVSEWVVMGHVSRQILKGGIFRNKYIIYNFKRSLPI